MSQKCEVTCDVSIMMGQIWWVKFWKVRFWRVSYDESNIGAHVMGQVLKGELWWVKYVKFYKSILKGQLCEVTCDGSISKSRMWWVKLMGWWVKFTSHFWWVNFDGTNIRNTSKNPITCKQVYPYDMTHSPSVFPIISLNPTCHAPQTPVNNLTRTFSLINVAGEYSSLLASDSVGGSGNVLQLT